MMTATLAAAMSLGITAPVITPRAGFNGQSGCYEPFSRIHQVFYNESIVGPNFSFAECRVIENPHESTRTRIVTNWGVCYQGFSFEATDSCGTYQVEMRGVYRDGSSSRLGAVYQDSTTWWAD
jgi:hypothetical protein